MKKVLLKQRNHALGQHLLQLGERCDAHKHGVTDGVVAVEQILQPVVQALEQLGQVNCPPRPWSHP